MQNALIYCRVSTEEQAEKGYSLDAQEKFCRSFADNNGYKVAAVYRDEGKSATTLDRPALTDLLSKCQQDKSINAMIVQETDRLARNTKDHLTIKALLKKAGVKLISVAQPMLDDSPEGMMIDTIIASVNQFQSDINSRKTRKGLQQRFEEGWYPGSAPLGYINASVGHQNDRKARKIIKKDPNKWSYVQEAFKMYLTSNHSVAEIGDILYKKGLRSKTGIKVPESVMFRILQNPFYAGLMKWNRQEKIGKHGAMITLNEHRRILQILDDHNQHACRRRKHSFLLRGFIYCNICGQRYTAEKHLKKNKEYYHCTTRTKNHSNQGQMIEVSQLEEQIEAMFAKIEFTPEFAERILKRLEKYYYSRKGAVNDQKQVLYNQKKGLELRRDKVEEKLFSGVLADDDFVRLKNKLKTELRMVQSQIDQLDNQKEYDVDALHQVIKFTHCSYKVYKTAPYELKRQYLGLFWEKFFVQDKKIISAEPTKLIQLLLEEKQVIISVDWHPSPKFIKTLEDEEYLAELRAKVDKINELRASLAC